MKKVLIVSGHPDIENNSVANRAALDEYARNLENAEIDRLDLLYPDYRIDVDAEKKKIDEADVIVFQYPLFWYGMPSLLQKWLEEVLLPGYAYGPGGTALKGKKVLASLTIGAPEFFFETGIPAKISEMTIPLLNTAVYTGMDYLGQEYITDAENDAVTPVEKKRENEEKARQMARRIISRIRELD